MSETFKEWAILELMGHRRLAGLVTEVELFGGKMLRIDIPAPEGGKEVTQFYGAQSVYALTPTTQEIATAVGKGCHPQPVSRYELPAPRHEVPAPAGQHEIYDDDDEGDEGCRSDGKTGDRQIPF